MDDVAYIKSLESRLSATAADVERLRLALVKATSTPSARVYKTSDVNIPTGAWTALAFGAQRHNSGGLFDSGSPSRFTAPVAGVYDISGTLSFAASAAGTMRVAGIGLNGVVNFIAVQNGVFNAANNTYIAVTTQYKLAAGDYVQLGAYQDSGGGILVQALTSYSPEFCITRISDG
jgi:hypothetical protein